MDYTFCHRRRRRAGSVRGAVSGGPVAGVPGGGAQGGVERPQRLGVDVQVILAPCVFVWRIAGGSAVYTGPE